jgi:hypothetical protein
MSGYVLSTEGYRMTRSQSLKVGDLGIDVGILLKWHVNNFSGLLYL